MTETKRELQGRLMAKNRKKAGMSQADVAQATGYYIKTIANWESGYTSPDMEQLLEYCDAIGVNMSVITVPFQHPELEDMGPEDDDAEIDEAFQLVAESMSPEAKKQMMFLWSGQHGGDSMAMLQLCVADAQCPLYFRYAVAQIVAANYEFAKAQGKLACPDSVQPIMEILERAIEQGHSAAMDGKMGYTAGVD